jgi:hypothetical protein
MSTFAKLKFVTTTKPRHLPAVQIRRNKLVHRIWEQIELVKSQSEGRVFTTTKYRTIRDEETGVSRQIEVPKKIRPWWFSAENGKVCVSIRYGSRVLELSKGRPSIEVGSAEELVTVLETVKSAVVSGELDALIDSASNNLRSGFNK